ncbi:MAG: ROK family transcriptional regulator [Propionibacteriaceae bacterium]|jgi:predicted NBD/HSP70 family sugar kinase|nr:ROK family transcriptional regulator [Propionibacteriaceae bacterium]
MMQSSGKADMTRSAVLSFLGGHGPTSRADLARNLGVSPALMTQLTKDLLDQGLITEMEYSPSRGGRPARLLGLAVDAGDAIGVKVGMDHITAVECRIDGTMLRSATEPFDASAPSAVADLIAILRTFLDGSVSTRLLGIGVATPGNVDEQSAGTVDSTQLGWSRMPLGASLKAAFDLPVLVDNNVNALATAESLYGQAKHHDNALVVTIGTGIGAGLIADGAVYRGHAGVAGEIGHIPTVENGPLCQCGAHGCLEAVIGQQALVNIARQRAVLTANEGIDVLRDRADSGDAKAEQIFAEAGHLFGRALAGVVNFFDPEVVIVSGEGAESWRHWMYGFEPAFRSGLVPAKRGVPIAVETWQDDRWAQGAACLVLGTPFDEQGLSGVQGEWVRQRLADTAKAQL